MSSPVYPFRLLALPLRTEQDLVLARQLARMLAQQFGFEAGVQTRIATALSEVARNAYQYAGGGTLEFQVGQRETGKVSRRKTQTFEMVVRDTGKGISELPRILAGRFRSEHGLGLGIIGAKRLMDHLEIHSTSQGTAVHLVKHLPPSAPELTVTRLQGLVEELRSQPTVNPLEEVQLQNQELMRAMNDSRERQEELARVDQELAETNTGVLALYDELETLHRIGTMLASKLDLRALVQSIIDVTTSLTDAELGAFYFRDPESPEWVHYASSGSQAAMLVHAPQRVPVHSLEAQPFEGMVHVPDLEESTETYPTEELAHSLRTQFAIRSWLSVPVIEANQGLLGGMVFTHRKARAFSERSERILASIALQAAVGIEKAKLFETVTAASNAKDQFLAMISHELRTPLNPAMAIISSLRDDPRVPAEMREDIAVVWRNIRLEARLIDDLLDFNRLIKGKLQLHSDTLELHGLIESVIEICREDLEAKKQKLVTDFRAASSAVHGDAARLQQVLWNVLKNAIKFTPSEGQITIRTRAAAGMISILVEDTGRGIEAAAMERIFGAFDQGQAHPAAHFGGLGLGLSIARMFMTLHGGKISASSPGPGLGATITMELPLSNVPAPAATTPQLPALGNQAVAGGHILLVDDHQDTLESLSRLLRRRGFTVTAANSAETACEAARKAKFDLLISDLGLPDCSGLELIGRVRSIRHVPAIALSGYGMESDVADSQRAGFNYHLTKPIEFDQLLRTVAQVLHTEVEN